jgi:AraC family transcriptional regulator
MTLTAEGLPSPHLQRKIAEVQAFLAQNLAYDVDLAAIARQAALSPYYFTRPFTAMVGMPPYRYLINLRIQRAAQLLRESDLTVTQILHRVGFHSPSHFTTTFRRHMGLSPTAYRRRYDFEQNANRFSRTVDPLVIQPDQRMTR